MRRIGAILVLTCLSGVAHAQDPRVDDLFGPTPPIRRAAQVVFLTRYLTDQDAIRALVDAIGRHLPVAKGARNPGVYDAISVLARVPPDSVSDAALRTRIVTVAHASGDNSPDTAALAALIEPRFGGAAQPPPQSLPPLPNSHVPAITPPARQTSYDYNITLGSMTVMNAVSRGSDTDYVSLVVIGPDGQAGPFVWGPQKLNSKDHPNLNLRSDTVRVANDKAPTVRISWTAANQGTSNGAKIALALGNTAADLARGSGIFFASIGGEIAKVGLSFLQSCDAPLFGGAVVLYTDRLGDKEFDQWEPEGPNRWHRVFDYPNIASPCGTGHYSLEIHVERQPPA
jgi:hypothetical protein